MPTNFWSVCKFNLFLFLHATSAAPSPSTIQIPQVQLKDARTLDTHIGSISIESCYITDYFGKAGEKNGLSWNLITNFRGEFGGLDPILRLGGHTQ